MNVVPLCLQLLLQLVLLCVLLLQHVLLPFKRWLMYCARVLAVLRTQANALAR